MRKRSIHIQVWLNEKEFMELNRNVIRTGLSREAYIRHLITGYLPVESPPPDYYKMMNELYQVGNNLNQIAKKAHVLNVMDTQKYDEAIKTYNEIISEINDTVIKPRKIE